MGYILLLFIGGIVLVGLLVMFMGGRRRGAGPTHPGGDVTHKTPAADEPTPAASSTASSAQSYTAQNRTPPA